MPERRRLFFGLQPPAARRRALAAEADGWQLTGRRVPAENYHVTVVFLGLCDQAAIAQAVAAAEQLRGGRVGLQFTRVAFWSGPRIEVLEPARVSRAARTLHDALVARLRDAGLDPGQRPWRPHLTLTRKAAEREPLPVAPQASWFHQLHLFESLSGEEGVRYQAIRSWSLCRDAGV